SLRRAEGRIGHVDQGRSRLRLAVLAHLRSDGRLLLAPAATARATAGLFLLRRLNFGRSLLGDGFRRLLDGGFLDGGFLGSRLLAHHILSLLLSRSRGA